MSTKNNVAKGKNITNTKRKCIYIYDFYLKWIKCKEYN